MKRWNILTESAGEQNIVSLILKNKGLDKQEFLNPPRIQEQLLKLSVEFRRALRQTRDLILAEVEAKTPIIIHGDYDADGICATAILYNTLKKELGYEETFHFIPNRFEHGYGLSQNSVDEAIKQVEKALDTNPQKILFITVDSGITSQNEVDYIKSLGHTVIVTDHHQKPDVLPSADIILVDHEIVGSTIAWILSKALGSKDAQSVSLAALATVTDLAPLLGFNRSLVIEGLKVLNANPPLGIKSLLEASGRRPGQITTYDLGWVIGPRINAGGRLVDAQDSLDLLIEEDAQQVRAIAQKLNGVNVERRDKTLEMYELAKKDRGEGSDEGGELPKIIVTESPDYHEGIIGLVASQLTQKHYRPSIVIALSKEQGKGSVRSVKGFDITTFLRQFEDLFINLGGHPMAGGFTISHENLPKLKEKIMAAAISELPEELLVPTVNIDLKIPLETATVELAQQLTQLAPFGMGNPKPVFLSENTRVAEINQVGREGQHTSLKLSDNGDLHKAIHFNSEDAFEGVGFGDKIDVVYSIELNEFNGKISADLVIKDFKKSEVD